MTDKIINRIKKMMALVNDPAASDGERENALRMSYALLAKYNLDMSDVEGKPLGPQEARTGVSGVFYARPWAVTVAHAIGKLFFCKYYFSRMEKDMGKHTFTGKESNASTAEEVARSLVESIRRESNRRMRQMGENATWRRSFATGAAFKVQERVNELMTSSQIEGVSTSMALTLVDLHKSEQAANELFIQEQGVRLKQRKSSFNNLANSAYSAGRSFGEGLNLSPTKKLR